MSVFVDTWGNLACFTNPFMKVERVSYDVMTPSAAKGFMRSLYWKPEFEWVIKRIIVVNPIQHHSMMLKELKSTSQLPGMTDSSHTLRHSRLLKDVRYIIEAEIVLNPLRPNDRHGSVHAYEQEARKRMRRGQQFRTPFFGMTDYAGYSELIEGEHNLPQPLNLTKDLGSMLFDMVPIDIDKDQFSPLFFRAQLVNGVLEVPQDIYREILPQVFEARNRVHKNTEARHVA